MNVHQSPAAIEPRDRSPAFVSVPRPPTSAPDSDPIPASTLIPIRIHMTVGSA